MVKILNYAEPIKPKIESSFIKTFVIIIFMIVLAGNYGKIYQGSRAYVKDSHNQLIPVEKFDGVKSFIDFVPIEFVGIDKKNQNIIKDTLSDSNLWYFNQLGLKDIKILGVNSLYKQNNSDIYSIGGFADYNGNILLTYDFSFQSDLCHELGHISSFNENLNTEHWKIYYYGDEFGCFRFTPIWEDYPITMAVI